jgi:Na+/H+-dicarboxylate symporter
VVLPLLLRYVGKVSPVKHFKVMLPALLTAFSSASSSATLPLSMECLEKGAGVSERTTSFVLPLGATVNMDGTALYECVAAIFLAQAYGLELSFATQFTVVLIALLIGDPHGHWPAGGGHRATARDRSGAGHGTHRREHLLGFLRCRHHCPLRE